MGSTVQREHYILRQEMVSLTTNLSGKVNEKIGDLNTIADTIQPLLRQEMVSHATNLFGRVNDKIAQKDQLLLKEEMVSITTHLSGKVVKINDLLTTTPNNDSYNQI